MTPPPEPASTAVPALVLHLRWGPAAVPGFAPVGSEAGDYAAHRWGPEPLPEVVAYHRATWPDVADAEGFSSRLTATGFDPAALVGLARSLRVDRISLDEPHGHPVVTAAWKALRAEAAHHDVEVVDEVASDRPTVRLLPEVAPTAPWVLRRALGASEGWNRTEGPNDLLDAAQLLDVLTRVVAWGGTLQLVLALRDDGALPPVQAHPLAAIAGWLGRHADAVTDVERFDVAGDAEVRYTARRGTEPGTRDVHLIDLLHRPQLTIGHFSPHRYPILDVVGCRLWRQDAAGIHLIGATRTDDDVEHSLPTVHRLTVRDKRLVSITVVGQRTPGRVTVGEVEHATIGAALAAALPGDTVALTPGRYGPETEHFPLLVPAGVTVRGALPGDVTEGAPLGLAPGDEGTVVDLSGEAPGTAALVLGGAGAALERLTVRRPPRSIDATWDRWPVVTATGVAGARVEQCVVVGDVGARGCADVTLAWNRIEGGGIAVDDATGAKLSGNIASGGGRGVAIAVTGGHGPRIDGNHLARYQDGIVVQATDTATVTGNDVSVDRDAIRVTDARDTEVVANHLRGGRAVAVHGGSGTVLRANTAAATDVGLLLVDAPTGTDLSRNRFDDCRVDVLAVGSRTDG